MPTRRLARITGATLAFLLVAAVGSVIGQRYFGPKTITAYFTSATGIYPGDEVRVVGVKVGTITDIVPQGDRTAVVLKVDYGVAVPAAANAVIVAQSLVAARYVQLTPPYVGGDVMVDGGTIPLEKTAIPVEWDSVKEQLTRLATELGPHGGVSDTSVSRFINSAANALGDNGAKLRQTLTELSGVGRVLAEGGGNIVDIIRNLQAFISTLRSSNEQIVEFQGRLATLTSVLDGSRSDLDAALTNISDVVGQVQRFISGSRDQTAEQIHRLAAVTQNLVDNQTDLEQVLHVAPTAIANTYNMFDPRTGNAAGVFTLNNLSNPKAFLCNQIGALENVTAAETAKLCNLYLGPGLDTVSLNNIPLPLNPFLMSTPPASKLIYTDPALIPGNEGTAPGPLDPPSVSAYTGSGDVPPPPGFLPSQPQNLEDLMAPSGSGIDTGQHSAGEPPPSLLPAEMPPGPAPVDAGTPSS
ncbi:MCE family protein [Mycolicibacterium pyrenivorans]|uniref:MCE family protein n=1 Tax=Mycolicibacterium pyrenivorans TaxID=187102 RepID=UPI0021F28C51|nr:MCE family protein [Mycolicibacterium pyrenivorans]MCV7152893.1 MCE family protein [Mycolicibacterium pyrenivorans]